MAHRRRRASPRPRHAGPTATTRPLRLPAAAARPAQRGQRTGGKGKPQYRVVVVQNEFDFEAPADENGIAGDGPRRPTRRRRDQRPADDARRDPRPARRRRADLEPAVAGTSPPCCPCRSRHAVSPSARLDGDRRQGARQPAVPLRQHPPGGVRPAPWCRASAPSRRRAGRPGRPGDEQPAGGPARRPQLRRRHRRRRRPAGLPRRCSRRAWSSAARTDPLSCCLKSSLLAVGAGGSVADFDHQVDHVMTRDPKTVTLQSSVGDRAAAGQRLLGLRPRRRLQRPEVPALAAAGGLRDELGDLLGLLAGEDAARHPARGGAVDAVVDRVEDAALGRSRSSAARCRRWAARTAPAGRRGSARSCRRCPRRRACGSCRSWSGRATGRSSGWPPPPGPRSRRRRPRGRRARGSGPRGKRPAARR